MQTILEFYFNGCVGDKLKSIISKVGPTYSNCSIGSASNQYYFKMYTSSQKWVGSILKSLIIGGFNLLTHLGGIGFVWTMGKVGLGSLAGKRS